MNKGEKYVLPSLRQISRINIIRLLILENQRRITWLFLLLWSLIWHGERLEDGPWESASSIRPAPPDSFLSSICPPVHPSIHLSIHPPIQPSIHSPSQTIIHQSIHPCIHPPTHSLSHTTIHTSIHPSTAPLNNPLSYKIFESIGLLGEIYRDYWNIVRKVPEC